MSGSAVSEKLMKCKIPIGFMLNYVWPWSPSENWNTNMMGHPRTIIVTRRFKLAQFFFEGKCKNS